MYPLLDTIHGPDDLKRLSRDELLRLVGEIRHRLLEVVSANGGHLASNLGSAELAVALHYVFDSPHDQIIWDVGHQAYPHKLLTDRHDRFNTVRQYQALVAFAAVRKALTTFLMPAMPAPPFPPVSALRKRAINWGKIIMW